MALLKIKMKIVDNSEGIKSWAREIAVKRWADTTACKYCIHTLIPAYYRKVTDCMKKTSSERKHKTIDSSLNLII